MAEEKLSFSLPFYFKERKHRTFHLARDGKATLAPIGDAARGSAFAEHAGTCSSRRTRAQAHFLPLGTREPDRALYVSVEMVSFFFPRHLYPGGSWGGSSSQDFPQQGGEAWREAPERVHWPGLVPGPGAWG